MASSELIEALQALAHERKIDEFYLIDRLEASLAKSYQHILDLEWDARVTIDRQTGKIYVYELVPVGEPDEETGEYSEFEERDVTPADVSRIAAQNAKSVISSIVREAGRQSIYEEFAGRVGDLVTGTVLQGTPDFTIIKIRDGVEAELPHYDVKRYPGERNERPAGEHYRHNQRLKVLIIEVRDPGSDAPRMRGEQARPAIVVSRTHPDLIRRLFEIEVPEIYDGLVEIKSIAREPGARSKVAVTSREHNTVAWPHLPSNTRPAAESRDVKIDQAVIGSCTNGRLEDMRQAADVLRGRKVHPDVRCIVIPATQAVYKQCIAEGLMDVFLDANCAVSTPTCGPCLGGYMGILAAGERCVSTSNRNFVGRMGDPTSEVYLASPAVAAASAVLGHIGLPEDIAE